MCIQLLCSDFDVLVDFVDNATYQCCGRSTFCPICRRSDMSPFGPVYNLFRYMTKRRQVKIGQKAIELPINDLFRLDQVFKLRTQL